MADTRSTKLRTHSKADLYRIDRKDPSGNPISYFEGVTFITVGNERRIAGKPTFTTLDAANAWFDRETGEMG